MEQQHVNFFGDYEGDHTEMAPRQRENKLSQNMIDPQVHEKLMNTTPLQGKQRMILPLGKSRFDDLPSSSPLQKNPTNNRGFMMRESLNDQLNASPTP